jgi:poly(hydroxyalkanoate) granule-associated protein
MTKKTTRRRKSTAAPDATARLRQGWRTTVSTLTSAQQAAEREVRRLVKKNRQELEGRLGSLQGRLQKEQRLLGRRVNEAVHGALAALDIPSRKEVAELTRKVDELSRRIGSLRRTRAAA